MIRPVALALPLCALVACADPPSAVGEIAGKAAGSLQSDAAVELKDPWRSADNMAERPGSGGAPAGPPAATELKDPFARPAATPASEPPRGDLKDPFAGAPASAPAGAPASAPAGASRGSADLRDPFGGPRGVPVDLRPATGVAAAIGDPFAGRAEAGEVEADAEAQADARPDASPAVEAKGE